MTSFERLSAVVRGQEVDRKPSIGFDGVEGCDAIVAGISEAVPAGALKLVTVEGVLASALSGREGLYEFLESEPEAGGVYLAEVSRRVREEAETALSKGADGICYSIRGAAPAVSTPMQYGGFILELDRAVLEAVAEAAFNLVFVHDDEEPYLDFLTDLPASALGWYERAGLSVSAIRSMRGGAVAVDSEEADIRLVFDKQGSTNGRLMEAKA